VRRRWACPPEGGAAATPNSTLLHSETLCPELVLDELGYKGLYERQRILNGTKVQRLNEQNVYLIVRDVIKQGRFPQEANVLGFTDFFCKELPRLKDRWK